MSSRNILFALIGALWLTATVAAQDQAEMGRLVGLGQSQQKQGRFAEAIQSFDRAGAIALNLFGPHHVYTATCYAMSGAVHRELGQYREAESKLEKALAAYENGTDSQLIAEAINNLAGNKYELGKYEEALALHQRSVKLMETNLGPDSPDTATARSNLAGVYERLGQSALAEPLYLRSVETLEAYKTTHAGVLANVLSNLANVYLAQGEMTRAVPLVQRAVLLKEQQYGPQHFEVARTLNNLGAFYSSMGQFEKAEETLTRTLRILESALGPNHADVARALTNLAEVEKKLKKIDKAEADYNRALKIREAVLGPDHLDVATSLEHLGSFYSTVSRYPEAVAAEERSLKIRRQKLPNDEIPAAYCLSALASISLAQHKNSDAEVFLNQVLRIRKQHLPANHPHLAETNATLGWMHASAGRLDQAMTSFDQSRRGIRAYVEQVLSVLSEPEQMKFLKNVDQHLLNAALSGAYSLKNQQAIDMSAAWVLNSKGVAQEVLAQRALVSRDATNPVVSLISQSLVAVRKQLATLSIATVPGAPEAASRGRVEELSKREAEMVRQMNAAGGRPVLRGEFVELQSVRHNIPDDAMLVEITRFQQNDFRDANRREFPEVYAAWIIPPTGDTPVKFVDLGPVDAIDAAVSAARTRLTSSLETIRESGELDAEQEWKKASQPLAKLILEPLLSGLGETQKLLLSPDSNLWIVPWAALPLPDGKYAVEKFDFRFLISGRDLIPTERKTGAVSRPILFADPNYDLTPSETRLATQELFKQNVETGPVHPEPPGQNRLGQVSRLPGTQKEAKAIKPQIESLANTESYLYSDKWALETVFKLLHQPQILVLSTHGFFLDADTVEQNSTEASNPLLRCGLLLAGCNKPPKNLTEGIEDGVLTGLEIVGTDLRDTDLVVLSACETGLGEVHSGEGVAGLRQAFQLAGARSVVATLWQIPDQATSQLMTDFFGQLAQGADRSAALRSAQLKMIAARRDRDGAAHPFFWAAFTITGR